MSTQSARASAQTARLSGHKLIAALENFTGRGAGTDAERRAAMWLAEQVVGTRREVAIEPFWCRPNGALAQAWHTLLALAGSLVSVSSPRAGGAMLLAALVFVILDALTGRSPGRWLTREGASQNVVWISRRRSREPEGDRLHLIITANYDAGREGLVYRDQVRSRTSGMRRAVHGITPGWQGWLVITILWLIAVAILRLDGDTSVGIGAIQLLPTIGLVLALALLLEMGISGWSPAAGDNGSGVTVAISLARALGTSPPRYLDVELVLTGAGDFDGIGLRNYLRPRRRTHRPANTVVLGIAPCTGGKLRWWRTDGSLSPVRFGARLLTIAQRLAAENARLEARAHDGRGQTPALPARAGRIPAVSIGCLDDRELVPESHQSTDAATAVDPQACDRAVQFGLLLVDAIDVELGARRG